MNELFSQVAMKVFFKGVVQGVGFRLMTKVYADSLHIRGYVKNLSDGSVELLAVGEKVSLFY